MTPADNNSPTRYANDVLGLMNSPRKPSIMAFRRADVSVVPGSLEDVVGSDVAPVREAGRETALEAVLAVTDVTGDAAATGMAFAGTGLATLAGAEGFALTSAEAEA